MGFLDFFPDLLRLLSPKSLEYFGLNAKILLIIDNELLQMAEVEIFGKTKHSLNREVTYY